MHRYHLAFYSRVVVPSTVPTWLLCHRPHLCARDDVCASRHSHLLAHDVPAVMVATAICTGMQSCAIVSVALHASSTQASSSTIIKLSWLVPACLRDIIEAQTAASFTHSRAHPKNADKMHAHYSKYLHLVAKMLPQHFYCNTGTHPATSLCPSILT